jgi:hypothetical protein
MTVIVSKSGAALYFEGFAFDHKSDQSFYLYFVVRIMMPINFNYSCRVDGLTQLFLFNLLFVAYNIIFNASGGKSCRKITSLEIILSELHPCR